MTHGQDPFDILAGHDPVDPEQSPSADSAEGRAMFDRIVDETRAPTPSTPRRVRLTPRLALALAALVVLAAVAMTFAFNLVPTRTEVACYAELSLDSDRVGLSNANPAGPEACVEAWELGDLANADVAPGEIPPLTACVSEPGALAVFPTNDASVCADLGIAGFTPDQSDDRLSTIADAIDDITLYIIEVPCRPLDEAAEGARAILDERGLSTWMVVIEGERPDRPCASLAVDTPAETVIIVGIPPEE